MKWVFHGFIWKIRTSHAFSHSMFLFNKSIRLLPYQILFNSRMWNHMLAYRIHFLFLVINKIHHCCHWQIQTYDATLLLKCYLLFIHYLVMHLRLFVYVLYFVAHVSKSLCVAYIYEIMTWIMQSYKNRCIFVAAATIIS